jgi:ADP-ribose pyrophosphatase YjhB (NUDIX family)
MSSHFSGGFYAVKKEDGKYQIVGITSTRFPEEVKLPGGTNKNAQWETPEQTLIREFSEETGLAPVSFLKIHEHLSNGHTKNFFLCTKVEGKLNLEPKREPDGDEIVIKLWDLTEFHRHCFKNYRLAFLKGCCELAKTDRDFFFNYTEICQDIFAEKL